MRLERRVLASDPSVYPDHVRVRYVMNAADEDGEMDDKLCNCGRLDDSVVNLTNFIRDQLHDYPRVR